MIYLQGGVALSVEGVMISPWGPLSLTQQNFSEVPHKA